MTGNKTLYSLLLKLSTRNWVDMVTLDNKKCTTQQEELITETQQHIGYTTLLCLLYHI